MRHFATFIIFGVLLQGCSENRNKAVSTRSNQKAQTESLTSAPKASAVPATAKRQSAMRNDKVTTSRAAPSITAEKKPLRAMTFNEAQFSDDASDYPSTLEAKKLEKEKYNQ